MSNFWYGKKVLVTGHTGFKGGWLSLWLQLLGSNVIGYSLKPPTEPNFFTIAKVSEGMTNVIADIRDFDKLKKTIDVHQPEIIIHMAAQALVCRSYSNPIETYSSNVMGIVHLLEAIRNSDDVKAIINVTSDKCYENKEWHWGYRENDQLGGHDPYSNSKACAELITSAYRDSFFLNKKNVGIATVRAGNVIGGGDWAEDRLIPDLIRGCMNNEPIKIRFPNALRPWQHLFDPINGYMILAEQLVKSSSEFSESWNFGPNPGEEKPVKWLADYTTQLWSKESNWILENKPNFHETNCLRLDSSKAKLRLNWKPKWNIEKGLHETIQWYKAYEENHSMQDISAAQIKSFINSQIKS